MKAPRRRQASSIDKLPPELQEVFSDLARKGVTVTEIHAQLVQMGADVSRSAVGRKVKTIAEIGEDMRRTEAMAKFVVEKFGDQPDDRVGRAGMRILQGVLFDLVTAAGEDDDGQPISISVGEAKELTLAYQRLQSAQTMDAERQLKIRKQAKLEAQEEAAKAVDKVAKREGGMSAELILSIKREILGIAA